MRFLVVVLLTSIQTGFSERNNVCKKFVEYNIIDLSKNCWYNPDVEARVPDIVARYGYDLEQYDVVTEDSFVLTVFRIPPRNGSAKGVVFLQHPALASASVWIVRGNVSLAFLLSDAGYDVWLGNFRANSYAETNKLLSREKDAERYWNYTFHEYGIYDLPAQINLVREKTNNTKKIIYIGHSVATSAALVYSSLKPDDADKNIKLFLLWSPITALGNVKTPFKVAAPFTNNIADLLFSLNLRGITYEGPLRKLMRALCLSIPSLLHLCSAFIDVNVGPQYKNGNPPELPVMITQSVEGFSVKTLAHFGQLVKSRDRFQWYDYGLKLNRRYYKSLMPPVYPVQKVKVPIRLVYGENDYFATEKDTQLLYGKLNKKVKLGIEKIDGFSHFDFHYGKNVDEVLHRPTVKYLDEYVKNNP